MQRWQYATHSVAADESFDDLLKTAGLNGWEAWHIEKSEAGAREVYFKRQIPPPSEASRKFEEDFDRMAAELGIYPVGQEPPQ